MIQPFDGDKFDKRYNDTFKPAIEDSGFEPYRVDNDNTVSIPINSIEEGIRDSAICFADITMDNPNVWYELGYAFATGKEVVLVSSDERKDKYPFDIQHKRIIRYKTGSSTDFIELKEKITKAINGLEGKIQTIEKLSKSGVADIKGLQSHEISLLLIILENQLTSEDSVSVYSLAQEMEKVGYTKAATSIGLRVLEKNVMIKTVQKTDDYSAETYSACQLTEKGDAWLMDNQDKLDFEIKTNIDFKNEEIIDPDDLPF